MLYPHNHTLNKALHEKNMWTPIIKNKTSMMQNAQVLVSCVDKHVG